MSAAATSPARPTPPRDTLTARLTMHEAAHRISKAHRSIRRWVAKGELTRDDQGLIDEWDLVVVAAEKDRNDKFARPRVFAERQTTPGGTVLLPPTPIVAKVNLADLLDDIDAPLSRDRPEELAGLSEAMTRHTAACTADPRFIADDLPAEDRGRLSAICAGCPIRPACHDYATTARPGAGFWAGVQYPIRHDDEGHQ